MAKVVDLHPQQASFALCGCTDEGEPLLPVVITGERPFVAYLYCAQCEAEVPVVNGYIGE